MSAETLKLREDPAPNSSIEIRDGFASVGSQHVAAPSIAASSIATPSIATPSTATSSIAAADPLSPAIGQVLDGKYRIERKLGEGAMGVVFAATHLALDEPVAIKFMRPEVQSLEGTLARFAKEAKIAARIRSEHVAKVLDVGEVERLGPYIVMEYLEGKSLADLLDACLLDRQGPMPAERVVEYVLQACEALAAAHAIGVIHRDVKPDNLFVTRHVGLETLQLLDFGISKAALGARAPGADVGAGTTALVMGTPLYMSPEQLRSLPDVDCRTDIWSLGAVMYELLSGRPPFEAASVPEICAAILDLQPAPLPPGCPAALQAVVMRCLEKDRERRFQTVAELASALVPLAPREARAYASRSSCLLRASALNLDVPEAAVERSGRSARFQSSALVAAATVLALSALGVALTLAKTREPAPIGLGTRGAAVSRGAPALAAALSTPPASVPANGASGVTPVPAIPEAAAPALGRPPSESPRSGKARSAARSSAPSAGPGSAASPSSAPAPEPAAIASERVGHVRLVEPRSRLRLVERMAPARPRLVRRRTSAAAPSDVSPSPGDAQ